MVKANVSMLIISLQANIKNIFQRKQWFDYEISGLQT